MKKKGAVSLPWQKIIVYLIILLVFIVLVALIVMWRGMGKQVIDHLLGLLGW